MLCTNNQAKETAVEMFKLAVKQIRAKMTPALSDKIQVDLMNTMGPKGITSGDCTISHDLKKCRVRFNLDFAAAWVENEGDESGWKYILKTVRHELFHAFQWLWIADKGGRKAIEKLVKYIEVTPYKESVMEKGAWAYEDPEKATMQNFEEAFAFLF